MNIQIISQTVLNFLLCKFSMNPYIPLYKGFLVDSSKKEKLLTKYNFKKGDNVKKKKRDD